MRQLYAALMISWALTALGFPAAATPLQSNDVITTTPIKHVIIILGENRTFDHLFGVYQARPGQSVFNILSEGIVNADGTPGPNFAKAAQARANVADTFQMAPASKELYARLPPAMTDSAPSQPARDDPPFTSLAAALAMDEALLPSDQKLLLTGATGLPKNAIDTRIANATALANGPYPLTPGAAYDAYTGNPTHRFFQMWQQLDCAAARASAANPSGCLGDLFAWVETSVGPGSNGKPQPAGWNEQSTGEGSAALGYYNMARGDAAYFKELADQYTLSDNYHQAVMGGTGANHVMLGTGDMVAFSDAAFNAAKPPENQIENPNPQPGTNNFYTQDGYGGGSYVACADRDAPGVAPILDYLAALPYKPKSNCEPGHYYLVNNYAPGYLGNGTVNTAGKFVIAPSHLRTIGDALLAKGVSFRYYGEGWNRYVQDPKDRLHCDICNFLQYTASIMTDPALRHAHIQDLADFYNDVEADALPAVSFVKPSSINDGHPASSKLNILEAFSRRLILAVQAQPDLWADTVIFITMDEGGGYWDSGYVQPIDFFGDGTRVPLIAVSPFSRSGRVVHSYTDHVSLLKFIEKNWSVPPVTARSRDNLPNPTASAANPYVPANPPAIGDLTDMFSF
ncbi:MAG TPA: alkaline phosphatase family protein [Stellaceae bacterium]|jgi:phospholipase C|nr:alkaline phosphatase family protein [Stellaceae bacterium]